jgi:hypothetical protein
VAAVTGAVTVEVSSERIGYAHVADFTGYEFSGRPLSTPLHEPAGVSATA